MTVLSIYKRYYPHLTPNLFQQDVLEQKVTDLEQWDATCEYWIMNDYRGQSIGKMIGYYDDLVSGKQTYGKPKAAWIDVGKPIEVDTYEPLAPCSFCGSDVCLNDHREERAAVL